MLALFVAAIVWAPTALWATLIAGLVGLAAHEWAQMSRFPARASALYAVLMGAVALAFPFVVDDSWQQPVLLALVLLALVFWLLVAPLWLLAKWRGEHAFLRAATGVVVLLPVWASLLYLHTRGPLIILGVLTIVWIADTAAYFAGRRFGRHKLAPSISPGKTWEGVIGAWLAVAAYAATIALSIDVGVVSLVLLASGLLYFSVLGDLYESWIKRLAGLKDSGTLLPGHGGILDRIDALTSTLPLATAVLLWLEYAQ